MESGEQLLFNSMLQQSDEAFLVYNISESCFIYANAAFENITKKSLDQLLNDPGSMIEVIHPEDQELAKRRFQQLMRKSTSTLLDFRIVRPDKTERWVRLKIYPIVRERKVLFLTGLMEDETARKASILNTQKVNGWKNSTLEILAHDLSGPISIVKMLASAIDQQFDDNENIDVLKWTKMIRDISQKNLQLIHDLIKKESLETAGVQTSLETVNLVQEISEVMKIYTDAQQKIFRQFKFTCSDDTIVGRVDSMKFLQIINNLISNSIKFTGADGHIDVHIEKLEDTAVITVSDNGIGIPRSLQPVLFSRYSGAGRQGVDGQDSIGLGMWIVKLFTEAHGGRVWFESEENKGCKMYIEIPLYKEAPEDDDTLERKVDPVL